MHVIERVRDRFQEGCSGCVNWSIGLIVGQIKWDLLVFKGASEMPSGFTGSRPPNFPRRHWSSSQTLIYYPQVRYLCQVRSKLQVSFLRTIVRLMIAQQCEPLTSLLKVDE